MHELSIAQEIVEIASSRVGNARIAKIRVEVGTLVAVMPDALRFCFDLAAEDTPASGAELSITLVPAMARCGACSALFEVTGPFAQCSCGHISHDWLQGNELRITNVEVL